MNRSKLTAAITCGCALWAHLGSAEASTFTFQGLGDLPGTIFQSLSSAVSADGNVVVGWSYGTEFLEPFRWTSETGMVGLGGGDGTIANAVSGDGSVVVGQFGRNFTPPQAFRWTNEEGIVVLGDFSGGIFWSTATGVSADGSVVVGWGYGPSDTEAFRWTATDGMVSLGSLAGPGSVARGVSADGTVVVGEADGVSGFSEAFRWTSAGGMVGLGTLPGGAHSRAYAVSADGNVVVGESDSSMGTKAFRWTSDGGMVSIGPFGTEPYSVSGDGSVVVGLSVGFGAFLWTEWLGLVHLQDYLIAHGTAGVSGWQGLVAYGVSADGRTIVGSGLNPEGNYEAWIATIPEPSTLVLAALGLIAWLICCVAPARGLRICTLA